MFQHLLSAIAFSQLISKSKKNRGRTGIPLKRYITDYKTYIFFLSFVTHFIIVSMISKNVADTTFFLESKVSLL